MLKQIIESSGPCTGLTPLHLAIKGRSVKAVEVFLNTGKVNIHQVIPECVGLCNRQYVGFTYLKYAQNELSADRSYDCLEEAKRQIVDLIEKEVLRSHQKRSWQILSRQKSGQI